MDCLPSGWTPPSRAKDKRATYLAEDDLDGLPLDLADFTSFFEQRKQRVRTRLLATLGTVPGSAADTG